MKRLWRILRPLVAVALLGLAVWFLWTRPEPLHRLLEVRPETLAALAGLALLNQVLVSMRLSLVVEHCAGSRVPATTWFRLTVVGNFLNLFVPQLGNVYRAVTLKREHKVSYATFTTGLIAFVWLDVLLGLVVAIVVIATLDRGLHMGGVPALAFLVAVFALLLAAPFIAAALARVLRLEEGAMGRARARVATLLATATSVMHKPLLVLRFAAINVAAAAGQVLTLWVAFRAIGAPVDLVTMVLFQVFVKLSNQVTITPGNLGLTELAYAALAHAAQCTAEQGVAAALLVRMTGMVVSTVLGVALGGLPTLLGPRPNAAELEEPKPPG